MEQIILYGAIFVAMYFLMIRPQQKRAQAARDMLNTIEKGTHVVTIGGLHGIVEELNDDTVVLDCEGVYLTFERRAIGRIVPSTPETTEELSEQPEESTSEVSAEDVVTNLEQD